MRLGIMVTGLLAAGFSPAMGQRAQELSRLDRLNQEVSKLTANAAGLSIAAAFRTGELASLDKLRHLGQLDRVASLGRIGELSDLDFGLWSGNSRRVVEPPRAWADQDPADSMYRAARSELNRGNYTRAAYLFGEIHSRYPKSSYTPDAYYWEAMALYRNGTTESLKGARTALTSQKRSYPDAKTIDDATDLLARVNAKLAQQGDARGAAEVERIAANAADQDRDRASSHSRSSCREDDDDEKIAALNALLQMDADRALPILRKVMARRDEGAVCLRRKAVFLISQHSGPDAESMLLSAVRSDPDREVREQAVFWLGQSGGERAASALDSILRASDDPTVQEKAIFALSQNSSPQALRSLRDYAMKTAAPSNLREQAIFWLGQSGHGENAEFLKSIYKTLKEENLKEKVIFAVSQGGGRDASRWLTEVAGDPNENIEMRKKAIFWLSQSGGASLPELFTLYERSTDRDIREQLIFAYSQRHERAAVDKLIDIAKTEKDRELRKKALFWLSQSRDPRVAEVLESILAKP